MRTRAAVPVLSAACLSLILSASTAFASPRGRVYVRARPPAALVEVRAIAPGPWHVWVGGHQRWDGRRYAWSPGRWAVHPRPRAVWVPARWVHEPRGWYFAAGYWR